MTSPRSTALLADAMASSLDPRLLLGAKTPPPRQQHLPSSSTSTSTSSRNSQQQELIIPLDSPSNIPHPASASSSSIAMRNPLDTWHTPVRDPHPVRRPSSSAGQQRPFFLHQSPHITSPPSTSATTTTRSPQNISTSTMSPTTLNPNLPPSSSATPAFFLECFGKDVTPGKRPAILIAQQDTSRDDDDSTSTAGQTTQLIIASPAEEHAPRMWPSISADSARTASPEPFGLSSQLDCALSLTKDRNADNDREEEDEQLEIKKSPYDSPPPRLGGLFDGLPTLSPSSSVRLPPEFRFGQQQQSPPLASSTRRVNWLRTNSDDGPVSSDGRARSEADVSHTRPPFPSTPDTEDEYANGDEDDDDDDRASIASSLLSLPVSVVTTASGGNNSRFLEEQREREQNRERENERERERSRFLSLTGAGNNTSLPTGRRGLGLSLSSAGKGAGGSAKETASNFLSALSSKRNPNSNTGSPSRSPARTPGTGSISFVTPPPGSIWNDIAEGSSGGGGGAASGTKGNGRRSRTASLLSAAGGFPLHLPLGVGSTKENGGSGSNSAGPPTPSGTSGPGAVVASWKRRGLAALTSPNMSSSSAALAERRGSMNAVMLNAGTTSPPLLPSPGPTFSPMARTGSGAGAAPMNPYFFPSAPPTSNSHQISTSAPQSEANTPPPHPHPPIPHRPASILLKPSLGGAIGVNSTATSRPQSTTSTQSANSSCASGSGSGSGSSGVGGRRASDGALAGMVMSSSNQPPQPSSLRMSVHDAVVGRGKVVAGGGGVVPSPTSSSSGTPVVVGGGGSSALGGPIFTREVRIGGWTYIGHKASGWVEYDIRVQTLKGTTIRASRRFSSFVALRKTLAKQLPHHRPSLPELPPRRHGLLHRYSPTHLEQRRLALQRWLHKILRDPRWGGLECAREFVLGGLGGVGVGVGLGMGMGVGMGVGGGGAGMQIAGSSLGVGAMLDGERVGGSSLTVASGTGTGTGTPFGLAGARA